MAKKYVTAAMSCASLTDFVAALSALNLDKITFALNAAGKSIAVERDGVLLGYIPAVYNASVAINNGYLPYAANTVCFYGDEDGEWVVGVTGISNTYPDANSIYFGYVNHRGEGEQLMHACYYSATDGHGLTPSFMDEATADANASLSQGYRALHRKVSMSGSGSSATYYASAFDSPYDSNVAMPVGSGGVSSPSFASTLALICWPLVIDGGITVDGVYAINKVDRTAGAVGQRLTIGGEEFVRLSPYIVGKLDSAAE